MATISVSEEDLEFLELAVLRAYREGNTHGTAGLRDVARRIAIALDRADHAQWMEIVTQV